MNAIMRPFGDQAGLVSVAPDGAVARNRAGLPSNLVTQIPCRRRSWQVKATALPSGAHEGSPAVIPGGVMRRRWAPSERITKIAASLSNAIRLPSGDHAGERAASVGDTALVKVRPPVPSAFTTQRPEPHVKMILRLSGDQAGAYAPL